MLLKIVGVLWILFGLLWTVKPEMLRNRLKRKINRKVRWIVFGFILVFGIMMMGSIFKTSGLLSKIVGIIGMIIAIRVIMLLTSKTSEKVFEWMARRTVRSFRIGAFLIFVIGVMLMLV